ncbi:MAG: N-acetylmuramoyl-L-alanine amidase, partial [Chloroflexota bacterium]|nr:N-acetylmuramoyl-L-alanine amidase [Chloroflexota bacterium]
KPWWEAATFYYSQWMGLDREEWSYFGDVTARPMYARWQHSGVEEDAIYLSWHTNGYNGHNTVVSGTVSYVYNNSSAYYKRTEGSLELQQAVHEELVHDIRTGWEVGWRDLGERQLDLGEVRMLWDYDPANRMPGVLLEIGYHDNVHDANALKEPRFNRLAARAVYQGVVAYFEEQGSVDLVTAPEPPERLRVQNVGGGGVRIAWQLSLTDTVGLRGEAATGYRVYTSTDGFGWGAPLAVTGTEVTLTGFAPGETCYIRLRAINDGGQSLPTEVLGARVGDYAPLLIVNGFDKMNRFDLVPEIDPTEGYNLRLWMEQINSRDYVVQHGAATPAHYAWDSAGNEVVAAGEVVLGDYALVDWLLGEESLEEDGTLNAAERAALTEFVGAGGALLISGSELAWDLVAQGRDPAFMSDTLHAGYVADDADTHTVAPAAGGIFAGLAAFSFDAPGEYNVDYPDVLTATAGATVTLHYADDVGKPAAVQYADGCARTLLLGFPFEVIRPAARGDVMARALDFLDECLVAPLRAVITAPDEGSYLNATPVFTGTAMGEGLRRVEVQAANGGTGSYWDGGDWITSTTWLTATGTATWSYTLPALPDGDYLLRARAVATETGESAQVQFMLDTVAPLTPTVLTPTQGLTLTTWQVELRWLAPADVGSPLSYQVAVDGVTCTVVSTVHPILLGAGPHCWRVRAVDAAGNIGPWTAEAHFTVELREVFLPLVLRNYAGATPPACETFLAESFESAGGGDWLLNAAKRVTEPVYAGDWAMRVGIPPGETGSDYSSIRRELTFPANATITLHYHVYPLIENDDSEDYHYVGPAGGLEITRSDSRSWEERSMDLTAYAGEEITLYFGVFNDGDENVASLTVDEIIIEVCYH